MSKICPKCKRPQKDPRLLGCEACGGVPFVDESEIVTTFTRDELKIIAGLVLKDWRVYLVAGIILAIGVGILYWQVHEQIRTQIERFQNTASNQITAAYSQATNQLGVKFQSFALEAGNRVDTAYSSITNQIGEMFQAPKVRQLVEGVAKGEAKVILETEVRPTVEKFHADAQFLRLTARAQAYDFKAYLRLLDLSQGTNELAGDAEGVVAKMDRSLGRDRSEFTTINRAFMWLAGTNFYSGPFTSDEIAYWFPLGMQDKTGLNREGFVNTILRFKQPMFLPRLIDCFTNETDLGVADRLTVAISDLAKEDFHPHDFKEIQTWWHSHDNEYTNWPFLEMAQGMTALNLLSYSNAAKSFNTVLQLDPSADMSRGLAVCSLLEIGQSNNAVELVKGFKDPTSRWSKWTGAMIELHIGNNSNATVQFTEIATANPAMLYLPIEGAPVWKRIDWNLFHKLTSAEKKLQPP
jgi:hypothetical protein